MDATSGKLAIAYILSVGLAFACLLGYFSHKIKLSPILGYLIAGYIIGPFSPGFVADIQTAEQLAEIGVILMIFAVGLHFHWRDLINVRQIAIPGAILQTAASTLMGMWLIHSYGWSLEAGFIMGVAIGIASTVVLMRILSENKLLNTTPGHIAAGWLIVEDLITVVILLTLPLLLDVAKADSLSFWSILESILLVFGRFVLLLVIMCTIGRKAVTYILSKIAATESHELFTVGVLAVTFMIAIGAYVLFATSIVLGAFIAGMVIGQTEVRYKALVNSLPLKDAFSVIFFLSIGMLFNPIVILDHMWLFFGLLAIILIVKPLVALVITWLKGYSWRIVALVSVALAQIGEFSFILVEEASKYKVLPDDGYDAIIACAIVSIAINPPLFKLVNRLTSVESSEQAPRV